MGANARALGTPIHEAPIVRADPNFIKLFLEEVNLDKLGHFVL